MTAVHKAPADCLRGKAGDVITVEFSDSTAARRSGTQRGVLLPDRNGQPGRDGSLFPDAISASDGLSALHDVLAEGGDDVQQLLMLSCRHLVLVKGLREVANNNVEFGVGDAEPGVRRLRRTADHFA